MIYNSLALYFINLILRKIDKLNAISDTEKIEATNLEIQEFFRSKVKLSESILLNPIKKGEELKKKIKLIQLTII